MTTIVALVTALLLAQWVCGRLARRTVSRMMRPADDWEPEDVDRWLDLIEPVELPDPTRETQS